MPEPEAVVSMLAGPRLSRLRKGGQTRVGQEAVQLGLPELIRRLRALLQ